MEGQSAIFFNFTILLLAALVGGIVAYRLKQPVILGYLLVGVAIGPHALGWVNDLAIVEIAANIGVALLMLTLGLEVSYHQLRQVGKVGFLGGIFQIIATMGLGWVAARYIFHWSMPESILFGLIISLSSTMVCMKILMDRGELDSMHGRIMMAMLILQDISAVFIIVFQPLISQAEQNVTFIVIRAVVGIVLFIAIAFITGRWALPWLIGKSGSVRSRELFLLTVLVLCLGSALSTQIFGLSAVFGAFLIGLVLRETRFGHQALAEVTPLRDVFAALFFVSLGMLLDVHFVYNNWILVLTAVGIILAIKLLVIFGIIRSFGYSWNIALMGGMGLFQIGEFSFIIAQNGVDLQIITSDSYALIIGASIITMLLTPFMMSLAGRLHSRVSRLPPGSQRITIGGAASLPLGQRQSQEAVIIAGFGRVGQNTALGLQDANIPYHIVEIDPEVVRHSKCEANVCTFGDASNLYVLRRVDLKNAKIMVITFPDPMAVLTTAKTAFAINPNLKIIARAHRVQDTRELQKIGVTELISPEYEASLEFIRR
ncbi:MAG: cation:proton antiporter, partial [Dehalococcoidales bacterium]|nr:cation:proton antiporter [Dehalococcoidales bacterium]